jgi:biopolymer transport protein ExbD
MSRFRDSGSDDGGEGAIDLSPMIDCVFILLIFFIVTTSFVEESGVEVDKPQAASASQLEKTSIILALTAKGEVVYGGRDEGEPGYCPEQGLRTHAP